jgi:predicted aconitase
MNQDSQKFLKHLIKDILLEVPLPAKDKTADFSLKIKEKLFGIEDFSALGYYAGKKYKDSVIDFSFPSLPSKENLKALSAAFSIFNKNGFTINKEQGKVVEIGFPEIDSVFQDFSSEIEPDLIVLGSPSASSQEFQKIVRMLRGKKIDSGLTLLVLTTEETRTALELDYFEGEIEKAGGIVVTEASEPLNKTFNCVLTNSALAAHRARECGMDAKLASLEDVLKQC